MQSWMGYIIWSLKVKTYKKKTMIYLNNCVIWSVTLLNILTDSIYDMIYILGSRFLSYFVKGEIFLEYIVNRLKNLFIIMNRCGGSFP